MGGHGRSWKVEHACASEDHGRSWKGRHAIGRHAEALSMALSMPSELGAHAIKDAILEQSLSNPQVISIPSSSDDALKRMRCSCSAIAFSFAACAISCTCRGRSWKDMEGAAWKVHENAISCTCRGRSQEACVP